MIRPVAFGYNPQTAESNAFQKKLEMNDKEIQRRALAEFDQMAAALNDLGINVIVLEDSNEPHTPDSIFPNNWFSTHPDGSFCLYPMEARARRLERLAIENKEFAKICDKSKTVDLTSFEADGKFLEGTGSLILDHKNRIAYACISSRTNEEVLDVWARTFDFSVVKFGSFDERGTAIYHTNVMMCLGDKFAVVCLESIKNKAERLTVIESLKRTGREIVDISFEQMNNFAGNMLLLKNKNDEKILVMSKRAFESLKYRQIKSLGSDAKLAAFDIETIEDCGGGSVRCMIAEVF